MNRGHQLAYADQALHSWRGSMGQVAELRPMSDKQTVFAVTTASGQQFILKNVADGPAAGRIESALDVLCYLHSAGVPVAVPLLTDDNRSTTENGGRVFALFPVLPADATWDPAGIGQVYWNIGAAIARLHTALAAYPREIHSWKIDLPHTVLEEAVPLIERRLSGRSAAEFADAVAAISGGLREALTGLPEQHIHGDCHGGNILVYRGDVSGFVDLDHLPFGPRVYDIGYLLADFAKARFFDIAVHARWLSLFDRVVMGYEQESALSRRERAAILYVMLATQLLFTHWFFQHGDPDRAHKNLDAFFWLYQRRDEIARRMREVRANPAGNA